MSSSAVDNLKKWFDALTTPQQQEVLEFLYGGKALVKRGGYIGPDPELIKFGLHCGPAPTAAATTNVCPTCGRPR
jgi:hypothetical protein